MSTRIPDAFPHFDQTVPDNGYAWWYVDAVSDDGQHALTLIAFIGSVFSPYYAWARQRRAAADPEDHCALNVCLYGPRGKHWAMTERRRTSLSRDAHRLTIGPSELNWDGESLHFSIDETTVPLPSRIRGEVRLWPSCITEHEFQLDRDGRHRWRPIAPCARVEVVFRQPGLNWSGHAYWDSNVGSRPLEADFKAWDWSRASQPRNTIVLYEGIRRDGEPFCLALNADAEGGIATLAPPDSVQLQTTLWRMTRNTRADGGQASVLKTLEDTPFYARSLLQTSLLEQPMTTVHESLSLDRFSSEWVRCLLPFRMPRSLR